MSPSQCITEKNGCKGLETNAIEVIHAIKKASNRPQRDECRAVDIAASQGRQLQKSPNHKDMNICRASQVLIFSQLKRQPITKIAQL